MLPKRKPLRRRRQRRKLPKRRLLKKLPKRRPPKTRLRQNRSLRTPRWRRRLPKVSLSRLGGCKLLRFAFNKLLDHLLTTCGNSTQASVSPKTLKLSNPKKARRAAVENAEELTSDRLFFFFLRLGIFRFRCPWLNLLLDLFWPCASLHEAIVGQTSRDYERCQRISNSHVTSTSMVSSL